MLPTIFGVALLAFLALLVLPVSRIRMWMFKALARTGQAAVLAFLGACGTFFVNPEAAPAWLTQAMTPYVERSVGLTMGSGGGPIWLVLAIVAVAGSLPVLMVVELCYGLTSQSVQLQAMRREIHDAAAWLDQRFVALGIRSAATLPSTDATPFTNPKRTKTVSGNRTPAAEPLVIDLLK